MLLRNDDIFSKAIPVQMVKEAFSNPFNLLIDKHSPIYFLLFQEVQVKTILNRRLTNLSLLLLNYNDF